MSISPLDYVLLQLGSPGYYLVFLGFLICCLQLPIVFTEYVFKFYTTEPPHRCKVVADHGNHYTLWRDLKIHKNEWYPLVTVDRAADRITRSTLEQLFLGHHNSSSQIFDQCNIYVDPVHHWKGKQPCPNGWEFWLPNNEHNLVTEFNLVCDNKFRLLILTHLISISGLCGALLFGLAADKLGRCRTLNFTIYLFIASTLSVYFVVDFVQFSIFYNLQIFFVNGLQISAYVLLLELFANPYQLKANFVWFTFRTLVSILASILLCAINNWRYVQLSIAVPSFAFITYLFVLPRSPLWQAVVKRNQRSAVRTLVHFSKFCGKPISISQLNQHVQNLLTSTITPTSANIEETINQASLSRPDHPIKPPSNNPSLSKPGPILRWYLLTHSYLFFVLAIINSELFDQHTLMLNQSHCIDSIYNALIDLSLIILSYQMSIWFGSRILQSLLFFLNGTLIVVSLVLTEYLRTKGTLEVDSFDFRLLLVPPVLMVLARSIGRTITILIWFHAVKSIPTNIRATGLACCFFWTQIAKLCVPHLLILSSHMPFNSLPGMFGILSIISAGLSLLFPRLEKKCWPNTLSDLEERRGNHYANSNSTISSKQFPTYRFTQTFPKARSSSAHDIFTIPSRCEFDPNRSNTVRSVQIRNDRLRKINEFLTADAPADHQPSLSSTSAKVETEKSSLSSGNNTLSGHQIEQSLIEISPSTSFTAQMVQTPRPSYVAYTEIDPFEPNPNDESNDNRVYTGRSRSIRV